MNAAIYVRMSTDSQTNSPERQRNQILSYCEQKGYRVVRQYEDLGMRGHDDTRPEFKRLVSDAKDGIFSVVVVDEQSRLTRNDPVTFIANVVAPLRDAGVAIDTVAKGPIDWDDLGGFIVGAINQHAASGEVVTLSRRVVTELARKALKGDVVAGKPPYGYDQIWLDEQNQIVHVGKRTWTKRPAGWRPNWRVNEKQAEIVRWIFNSYLDDDLSLSSMAKELASRSVPSPRGGKYWGRSHLRNILTNRAYVGDWLFNRETAGTFHKLSWRGTGSGRTGVAQSKPTNRNKKKTLQNDAADWVVITDHHSPIVSREVFSAAQAALKNNRDRCTPAPSRGDYVLSNMLSCSKCGSWFVGNRDRSGRFYTCGGYAQWGPNHCAPFRVRESDMTALIVEQLEGHFLSAERIDWMLEEARAIKGRREDGKHVAGLQKRVREVAKNIEKGTKNILLLDSSLVPSAQAQLKEWERERANCQAELDRLGRENPVGDIERLIEHLRGLLWDLRESLSRAQPEATRRVFRQTVVKMELNFETEQKTKRRRHHLTGGVIHFVSGDAYALRVADSERKSNEELSTISRGSEQLRSLLCLEFVA